MIKIEHTLFALPFAFLGALLAAGGLPTARQILWIVLAMVGARSAAMAFNRIADRSFDAKNPRTATRAIPAGLLTVGFVWAFTIVSALLCGLWVHLSGRAVFIAGPAAPVQADLEFLKTLIEGGRLRSVVGRTYALRDIVEAHRYADTGHKVGNVVVLIDEPSITASPSMIRT